MLEHEPLITLLRLLHIGMHPLKNSSSPFWNLLRLAKVSAHNSELNFGVGNGVHGCMGHAGYVAFHIITSLIITVLDYKLWDTHLTILSGYALTVTLFDFSTLLLLQVMRNVSSREHPSFKPNGYGISKSPHLLVLIPYFFCPRFVCRIPKNPKILFSLHGAARTYRMVWCNPFGHRSTRSASFI